MGSPTQNTGFEAESLVLNFLRSRGLALVARQWRCRFGEIDLIMRDGATLVFVEVKQRKSTAFGGGVASLTPAKLEKVQRAIALYLAETRFSGACRLDAVVLTANAPPEWMQNLTG